MVETIDLEGYDFKSTEATASEPCLGLFQNVRKIKKMFNKCLGKLHMFQDRISCQIRP